MINQAKTILITGGTGFAGSHLLQLLESQFDAQLIATSFSQSSDNLSSTKVKFVKLDLTNRQAVFELFQSIQPDWVFHLAAISTVGSSFDKAAEVFNNNTTLQLNILEAVRQVSKKSRVLIIGSGAEYGKTGASEGEAKKWSGFSEKDILQPLSPYAVSKVTQDLLGLSYFLSYDLDIVRVRPFNHIGEGQTKEFVIPAFASQIVAIEKGQQQVLQVGNLEAVRDMTDVKDVVKAYVKVMQDGQAGEVYNIGSGKGHTIQELLDMMVSLAQVPVTIEVDKSRLRPDSAPLVANIEKIKQLGWSPEVPIEQTLGRVLEEWRKK